MSEYESPYLSELEWRKMIEQTTHDQLDEYLQEHDVTFYCGFDPTADSLHVGHLLPLMLLAFGARHGHHPIALMGGATGLIGDPSGKSAERDLQTSDQLEANLSKIEQQVERVLSKAVEWRHEGASVSAGSDVSILNNIEWLKPWTYLGFLRDVGKHFRVNSMISKDSVRARLEDREQGISYTEFSYMLIQAYDFLHLSEEYDCKLQVGGSDQWGNITAGTDLIGKAGDGEAFGLTCPLITTAEGNKIGKTGDGAVWLDPEKTSPYEFYQYWVRRRDEDVPKLLRFFTFLEREEIDEIEEKIVTGQNRGEAQEKLAYEVTALVHGEAEAKNAVQASDILYGGTIENMTDSELQRIFSDVPSMTVSKDELSDDGIEIRDLFADSELQNSRGAAKRLIRQGGAYLNNEKVEDINYTVTLEDLASESMIVLRSGKKNYQLVRVE
jgi:tyrosyl-tRNA synthetase